MTIDLENPTEWATAFGLADAPLFAEGEIDRAENHKVLLDGGYGSFALSVGQQEQANISDSWIWSADIPHHVGVMPDVVTVTRWDDSTAQREFSRRSVEERLQSFYRFLTIDRVEHGRSVVDHSVGLFRKLRSILANAEGPDQYSIDLFVLTIANLVAGNRSLDATYSATVTERLALDSALPELLPRLNQRALEETIRQYLRSAVRDRSLSFWPALAVRHAGGLIFQEAHFELLRPSPPDLFGHIAEPELQRNTRGGVHFTPPALARSIVEQSLQQITDLRTRESLTVVDPACGSGSFLHETLRALHRSGFNGHLVVVGLDTSRHAVTMARFVIQRALEDWTPRGGCDFRIEQRDSLDEGAIPSADLIVMNPPFIAWPSLNDHQKEQVADILGSLRSGRADLSMAFVANASDSLNDGGVLGTLFPASVLSLKSAEKWRESLLDSLSLRFLATLGEYGLFSYAMVQVAAAVFAKAPAADRLLTLWTEDDRTSTGEAFRALRSSAGDLSPTSQGKGWRVSSINERFFAAQPTWRLRSTQMNDLLEALADALPTTVGNLFEVRQGIRTGANDVFILSRDEWGRLPKKEREYFRKAVLNRSVDSGRLKISDYVFYPYGLDGALFTSEAELRSALPNYFGKYLLPNQSKLMARSGIGSDYGINWWELTRHRSWMLQDFPRIVSKYFGGMGGFALDLTGECAIVQGFGWIPKKQLNDSFESLDEIIKETYTQNFLGAYTCLFNSKPFNLLLSAFSPQVAGGQFDLSSRHVQEIPVPDMAELALDPLRGQHVFALEELGHSISPDDANWVIKVDRAVSRVYGTEIDSWRDL